ncbi:helix-turn-helix domain-containing protein [Aeromonas sobria]|uniref:helix-turn-helix domain-containing protein n=1 Tax=Aeromonas sobria TaxID=646 RepID=UPI00111B1BE5|nr:helix-turn-helix domain-containing protein [Aeromonas sobria]
MKDDTDVVAVLTGDIVGSTSLSDAKYEDMQYTLYSELTDICTSNSNRYEITRGDAFQLIITAPEKAAIYSLLIRASLKGRGYDCRISIGIAKNSTLRDSVSKSTGEAFILSGRSLDKMKAESLVVSTSNERFNEDLNLLTKYVDRHVSKMTSLQCQIGYYLLKTNNKLTQREIAEMIGVSRVTVTRSIGAAEIYLLRDYVDFFSKKVKEIFI